MMVIQGPDSDVKRDGAAATEFFSGWFGIWVRKIFIGYVNNMQQ